MKEENIPMDAEIQEEPKTPEAFYGTSAPQKTRSSHVGLVVCLCLVLILLSTVFMLTALANLRLLKEKNGWRLNLGTEQFGQSADTARVIPGVALPDGSAVVATSAAPVVQLQSEAEAEGAQTLQQSDAVVCLTVTTLRETARYTGVIFTSDGYVLSACGDLAQVYALECSTADGRTLPISYLGTDGLSGLTLLKLDAADLPTVCFGSAADAASGDTISVCAAEGCSQGGSGSGYLTQIGVDSGSGLTRLQGSKELAAQGYGCPIFDSRGLVIGLTTAADSPTGEMCGVAADGLQAAIDRILEQGQGLTLWSGFDVGQIPWYICSYYDCPGSLWIRAVLEPGAVTEGLREHDILLEADGRQLQTVADYQAALAAHTAGDTMELLIYRYGDYMRLTVLVQGR